MGQLDTTPPAAPIPAHGPVVFPAPPGGWSQAAYGEAIAAFITVRGRAPKTVTMHPNTLAAVTRMVVRREVEQAVDELVAVVHREEQVLERVREALQPAPSDAVKIVTSEVHDRTTIVMT
jgi:transcription antitermination factor NusA-like protein